MTFEEQTDFVRNLKGASSSVLWILLLSGRSLTARQLEEATNYSDKPITRALRWLEARGYVQNNGRLHGWSLGRSIQLHLPFDQLTPGPNGHGPPSDVTTQQSEGLQRCRYDTHHRSSTRLTDRNNPDLPIQQDRNNSELRTRKISELPTINRNISDLQSETFRSTSPDLICTVTDLSNDQNTQQPDQTRTEKGDKPRNNSDHPATCHLPLATFLQRIQMRSPAYERILARDNLPEVVAWYWESLGQEWMDNPNGWIVRRLDQEATPLPAYLEFARTWLTMTDEDLQDYYTAGSHPYGPQDFWSEFDLSPDAITAYQTINKAGGLDLFDDFPRPIIQIKKLTADS